MDVERQETCDFTPLPYISGFSVDRILGSLVLAEIAISPTPVCPAGVGGNPACSRLYCVDSAVSNARPPIDFQGRIAAPVAVGPALRIGLGWVHDSMGDERSGCIHPAGDVSLRTLGWVWNVVLRRMPRSGTL